MSDKNQIKHVLTIYYHYKIVSNIDINEYQKPVINIGRTRDNDIVINSRIVSQHHAIIEINGEKCVIKDNNSTNGLLINNSKVKEHVLKSGDNIKIDDIDNPHDEGILLVYTIMEKDKEEKWAEYLLNKESIVIGRGSDCDLSIVHSSISRQHARIVRKDGAYTLEDLKSTNGTFLNGQLVASSAPLKQGDVIFIGNTKLIFQGDKLVYNVISRGLSLDAIGIGKNIKEKKGLFKGTQNKKLLNDININIKAGELVALVGGSGAGKSTFMDTINGFRKATEGTVLVNNDDFYENYNIYKNILGYVPQQDIVYDILTVEQMLVYAAELRMPKDTTKEELKARVHQVIVDVELDGKEQVYIKNLSGGQKKRASIAVELLADPQLFFLDEPTSGLDPGMERNMMQLLKKLSNMGKTIILITHAMANLHLCDKVVFLGRGGRLCYFGPPAGALDFFNVHDYVDIYNLITEEPERFEGEFKNSNYYIYNKTLKKKTAEKKNHKKLKRHSTLKQFTVLCRRYFKLTVTDTQRFWFMLIQAPLIAVLLGIVLKKNTFDMYESTSNVIFTLSCSAVWIGVLNSIQEICKERVIFRRERAVNLQLLPYMGSKLLILGMICLIQSILMIQTFHMIIPLPDNFSLIGNLKLELMVSVFLTLFAATSMGLAVSAMVSNTDRAMGIAPILLVPQLIFSGFVFKLSGLPDKLAYVIISKWSVNTLSISLNLNALPLRMLEENKDKPQIVEALKQIGRDLNKAYDHELSRLYQNWKVLLLIALICIAISMILLNRKGES